jgi:hypothetical protein
LIPVPKPAKEPKTVCYLEDQRKIRENNTNNQTTREEISKLLSAPIIPSTFSLKDIEKAKKKALKLEKLAEKQSLLLENSSNKVYLEESQSVESLLISSIRTKLAILNKLD